MTEHDKGLRYSHDETLTITQLKTLSLPIGENFSLLRNATQEADMQWTIEGESDFHYKLLLIKSKPYIMYYMGNLALLDLPILGIVGPRQHSNYATDILTKLFSLAPGYAFATISGLAPGVDQLCHRLSLQKGIPTIAVLGGGLQQYLAGYDRELITQIVAGGGLVLSEFKLYQQPQQYTFPQRNRIIAGLSDVIFLPEASNNSGSLITANFALEMNKPLYGVPNSIFALTSAGVNQLISSGAAHAVNDIQLFLDACFTRKDAVHVTKNLPDLSSDEHTLISFLSQKQTCSLTDFLSLGSFSSQQIISLLTLLEMKNYIVQESPGAYKLSI